jgi:hypothetical protein
MQGELAYFSKSINPLDELTAAKDTHSAFSGALINSPATPLRWPLGLT